MTEGRADAVFVVEPFQQIVLPQGGSALASSYVDTAPDLSVAMYFTSKELVAENPDLVLPKWPADVNTASVEAIAELAQQEQVLPEAPDIADLMP